MLKNDYGLVISNNFAYKCCRYLGIKAKSKHVGRPSRKERETVFDNLVMRTWKNVTRPYEIIVSDMTAFYANYHYYELTLYFDVLTTHSEQMRLSTSYPVAQIDPKTNEVVHIFSSVAEAELATGNTKHISDVVNGKRKTCKGFIWKKIK